MSTRRPVYQFKISLTDIHPLIWRRFRVYGDGAFADLHDTIQIVMGWEDYHLYEFRFDWTSITSPYAAEGESASQRLDKYVTKPGARMLYTYDFGDWWQHDLVLEKILHHARKPCPICLAGNRACPPEDCGGIWGYYDLVKAMKQRRGRRYREYKEWLGERFDPAEFNLAEVNRHLAEFYQL